MKITVLRYLAAATDATAAEVAEALGASMAAAGMSLLRLCRGGLVQRAFDPERRCHYYSITPRGAARLNFLERGA